MGLSLKMQKRNFIRVVDRWLLRVIPILNNFGLANTKMWCVIILHHPYLQTGVYVMKLTWLLESKIALYEDRICIRTVRYYRRVLSCKAHDRYGARDWISTQPNCNVFILTEVTHVVILMISLSIVERNMRSRMWKSHLKFASSDRVHAHQ